MDGVAPIWMVGVSAAVIFLCTIKVQKKFLISSGTGSPWWSRKKGSKMDVCVLPVNFKTISHICCHLSFNTSFPGKPRLAAVLVLEENVWV